MGFHSWSFRSGYGGRIDNPVDTDVLRSYLKQYFSNSYFSGLGKGPKLKFGPGFNLSNSTDIRVHKINDLKNFEN